ncbi:hypothetical protein ACFX2F_008447 [Malus domestica]
MLLGSAREKKGSTILAIGVLVVVAIGFELMDGCGEIQHEAEDGVGGGGAAAPGTSTNLHLRDSVTRSQIPVFVQPCFLCVPL